MLRRHRLGWFSLVTVLIALTGGAFAARAAGSGWLGIYSQSLTPELREGLDFQGDGVLVNRVVDGSPAERAGLEKGDIILSVEGRRVDSPETLADVIQSFSTDESVSIRILRDGERQTLDARLTARPDEEGAPQVEEKRSEEAPEPEIIFEKKVEPKADSEFDKKSSEDWEAVPPPPSRNQIREMIRSQNGQMFRVQRRGRLGVQVDDATRDDDISRGAKIEEVLDGTPADRAGLRKGDIITRVDSERIGGASDLVDALRGKEGRVRLEVYRNGEPRTIEATLETPRGLMSQKSTRSRIAPRNTWTWEDNGNGSRSYSEKSRDDLEREVSGLRREIDRLRRELEDAKRER